MKYVHTVEIVKPSFLVIKFHFFFFFFDVWDFFYLEPEEIWEQNREILFFINKIKKSYERIAKEKTIFLI